MNRRYFQRMFWPGVAGASLGLPKGLAGAAAQTEELRVDGTRLNRQLSRLSEFGRNELGGVSRVAYSEADRRGREYAQSLMRQAGLRTRIDAGGNLIGVLEGSQSGLEPIMTGSHIDTVPEGGNYDGPVGALSSIEAARTLTEKGRRLRRPLEVVVFANEEGGQTGARAMAGRLLEEDLKRVSHSGKTLEEGIAFIGGDPGRLDQARRQPGDIFAYLELHIEQGPILYGEGIDIGVVEGIVGIHRWMVEVEGFANHAGTTPMDHRRDALLAAGRFVDAVNRIVTGVPGRQVGTVGWIEAQPGAPNVVPGRVRLTLEMRDLDWDKVDRLFARIRRESDSIGRATGTEFSFEEIYDNPPRPMHGRLQDLIAESARELGLSHKRMPSGAGHDAQSISHIVPAGMLFVPSRDGISHSGREWTAPDDVANGANVLLHSLLRTDALEEPLAPLPG